MNLWRQDNMKSSREHWRYESGFTGMKMGWMKSKTFLHIFRNLTQITLCVLVCEGTCWY